ncbi:MAG TPA: Spy/CpxP family protein refolding chaperone [Bryobacteraceae bacterium]|nr:Spy/CpxP family protein refolding chaperone [Bryobacteraceae bacterium]
MILKKTVAAAVLAIGLTIGATAAPKGNGRMMHRIGAELNLTDAQKQHARDLFRQGRQELEPVTTELRRNREELAAAVKANNTAAIQQLTERQGQLKAKVSAVMARNMATFYAQLTPEQRTKADQLWAKHKGQFGRVHRGSHADKGAGQ